MRRLLALAFALALTACSMFGGDVAVPKTPRQQLYALEVTYEALLKEADDMVAQGTLSKDNMSQAVLLFSASHKAMDAADAAILAGDPTTIVGALETAQSALNAFTVYLQGAHK